MTESPREMIERLSKAAETPERVAMSRSQQFPTVHGRITELERELETTRRLLREAVAALTVAYDAIERSG